MAKFDEAETKVLAISTDNTPSQAAFAEKINVKVTMLSDFSNREVSKAYGVLMPQGVANRSTFVIDKEGKIVHIEEGSIALDPTGAETACSRLAHKAQ